MGQWAKNIYAISYNIQLIYVVGGIGVAIFFVISGDMMEKSYRPEMGLFHFYKTRFLRILLPFYITYMIAFVANIFVKVNSFDGVKTQKAVLTLFAADGYFPQAGKSYYIVGEWFTTVLLMIYLLFPMVHFLIKKYTIQYYVFLLFFDVLAITNIWTPFHIVADGSLFVCLTVFSAGVSVSFMQDRIVTTDKISRGICKFCIGIVMLAGIWYIVKKYDVPYYISNSFLGISVYFSLRSLNLPEIKCVSAIGKMSYYIYLTHHFVLRCIVKACIDKGWNWNYLIGLMITIVITVLFSLTVYCFERLIRNKCVVLINQKQSA